MGGGRKSGAGAAFHIDRGGHGIEEADALVRVGLREGEGHVVEVEGEGGVAEEFEADGGVEEAVGFVHGFGGEVDFCAILDEGDALEAFLLASATRMSTPPSVSGNMRVSVVDAAPVRLSLSMDAV